MKIKIQPNIISTPEQYRVWMKKQMPILFKENTPESLTRKKTPRINGLYKAYNSSAHNLFLANNLNDNTQKLIKSAISDFTYLKDKFTSMSQYKFKLFLKFGADKYLKKRVSADSLDFVNPDNTFTRLLYKPFEKLFRITVHNQSGDIKRGYLIEDSTRIIKNFDLKRPGTTPHIYTYGDEKYIESISQQLDSDLSNLLNSMSELKKFQ